jgi:hypothetical protein
MEGKSSRNPWRLWPPREAVGISVCLAATLARRIRARACRNRDGRVGTGAGWTPRHPGEQRNEGSSAGRDAPNSTGTGDPSSFSGDERTVIDGPFAATKELVAGFTIIRVKSLAEAIEWVKRAPNVSPNGEAEVEIRKLMDVEDFGEGFTPNPDIAKVKFK